MSMYDSEPISQLPPITSLNALDVLPITDVIDKTESPSGTTKKVTIQQLSDFLPNQNFNYSNIQFVASNGDDANSGFSFNEPKATPESALANITNEGLIWIVDSSLYNINLIIPFNISLFAPNASLSGTILVQSTGGLVFVAEFLPALHITLAAPSSMLIDVKSRGSSTITINPGSAVYGNFGTKVYGDTEFLNNLTIDQLLTAGGYTYPNGGSTTPGYVMTATAPNTIALQPPVTGFTSINTQTFTTSATYTPTVGMSYCVVECVGAGGGGGGADSGASVSAAAGGGGGGAYARSILTATDIGVSQTVTIGSGGAGGVAGNNNGANGGSSALGSLVIADGGSAGFGSATSGTTPTFGIYGAGGGGGVGQLVKNGDSGFLGVGWGTSLYGVGGQGGDSFYGIGGEQLVNLAGANGFNYGSGGGGGSSGDTGAVAGGNGADGIVIITEYVI